MRLQSQIQQQAIHIQGLEERFTKKNTEQMDLTSDMSRQYKSMQSELLTKTRQLETQNHGLLRYFINLNFSEIERLENVNKESTKEFEEIIASKDMMIEEQASKISYITREFENMLAVRFKRLIHSKPWQR